MGRLSLACPHCSTPNLVRSSRRRWFDVFLRLIGLKAYRCHSCLARFYSWKSLVPDFEPQLHDLEAHKP
jgi:hypothetical protein